MKLRTVEKEISRVMDDVDVQMRRLADRVRSEHVLPLCRRRRWTFLAGMGTWAFYDRKGVPVGDETVPDTVRRMLDVEVYGPQVLGFWVDEVHEKDIRERRPR